MILLNFLGLSIVFSRLFMKYFSLFTVLVSDDMGVKLLSLHNLDYITVDYYLNLFLHLKMMQREKEKLFISLIVYFLDIKKRKS